jgi:hypothetical protein
MRRADRVGKNVQEIEAEPKERLARSGDIRECSRKSARIYSGADVITGKPSEIIRCTTASASASSSTWMATTLSGRRTRMMSSREQRASSSLGATDDVSRAA